MTTGSLSKRSTTAIGVVAGLVAALVALGVAELVAGLKRSWKSPVLDVGDRVVDRVPPFVKDFAIEQFGTNDKLALLVGIGVFLALYAAVMGAVAFRRRIVIGVVGIAVFGLIGAYAALTRRVGGSIGETIPSVVGAVVGAGALWFSHRTLRPVLPSTGSLGSAEQIGSSDAASPGSPESAEPPVTATSASTGSVEPPEAASPGSAEQIGSSDAASPGSTESAEPPVTATSASTESAEQIGSSEAASPGSPASRSESSSPTSAPDPSVGTSPAPVDVRGRVALEGAQPVHESAAPKVDKKRAGLPRRQVLVQGGGLLALLAVAGAGAGALGRSLKSRFSASESRALVRLPAPPSPLAAVPDGVSVGVDGMVPFVTPNADFYRIDTALTVPQLPTEDYELRVTGMVDEELTFTFDELLARDVVEYDITLTCVSNTVGGNLVGNARWLGVRLDDLLAEAGVQAGADQVVGRSIDGYTCGFPLEAATDGRNAMVAFGMNGEALPLEHGFPVRLVVPGLYGYVSATKWLVEIEVTTFEDFEQYWVPRGYADRAPIKLMSRIDTVDGLGKLTRGPDGVAAIGGVAWAQTRGISKVEVQVDDGDWQPAELGEALNADTWRQWAFRWTPAATGRSTIRCRAVDSEGVIQTDERSEPLPDGASGHHQIVVFVE